MRGTITGYIRAPKAKNIPKHKININIPQQQYLYLAKLKISMDLRLATTLCFLSILGLVKSSNLLSESEIASFFRRGNLHMKSSSAGVLSRSKRTIHFAVAHLNGFLISLQVVLCVISEVWHAQCCRL